MSPQAVAVVVVKAVASAIFSMVISSLLAPKPKSFSGGNRNLLQTNPNSIAPWRAIYGQARVGGTVVFVHEHKAPDLGEPQYIHLVVAIAGHACEAIDDIWIDEKYVHLDANGDSDEGPYAGQVHVEFKLGAPDQVAMAGLVTAAASFAGEAAACWTNDHRLRGRTYAWIRLRRASGLFEGGLPNITFTVRGKNDIYDPRDESTGYTTNAALCTSDYMTWSAGLGASYDDEIGEDELISAANVCDEDIMLADETFEKRYTVNGAFDVDAVPKDVIERMLGAMAGEAVYVGGRWRLYAGAWRAPTVGLGLSDLRSPIHVQARSSRRELFNAVKGVFVSPHAGHLPTDYPPVTNATYEAQDGERIFRELDLPFTNSSSMAQRIAKIELERARQQILVQATFSLGTFRVAAPDVVSLSLDVYGWEDKPFEIRRSGLQVSAGPNGVPVVEVPLELRETAEGIYDWADGEETTGDLAPDTNLPNFDYAGHPTAQYNMLHGGDGNSTREWTQTAPTVAVIRPNADAADPDSDAALENAGNVRDADPDTFGRAYYELDGSTRENRGSIYSFASTGAKVVRPVLSKRIVPDADTEPGGWEFFYRIEGGPWIAMPGAGSGSGVSIRSTLVVGPLIEVEDLADLELLVRSQPFGDTDRSGYVHFHSVYVEEPTSAPYAIVTGSLFALAAADTDTWVNLYRPFPGPTPQRVNLLIRAGRPHVLVFLLRRTAVAPDGPIEICLWDADTKPGSPAARIWVMARLEDGGALDLVTTEWQLFACRFEPETDVSGQVQFLVRSKSTARVELDHFDVRPGFRIHTPGPSEAEAALGYRYDEQAPLAEPGVGPRRVAPLGPTTFAVLETT